MALLVDTQTVRTDIELYVPGDMEIGHKIIENKAVFEGGGSGSRLRSSTRPRLRAFDSTRPGAAVAGRKKHLTASGPLCRVHLKVNSTERTAME